MGVYDVMTEEPSDATRNQHFLCKEGNAEKPKDRDTSLTSWRGRCLTSMVPFTIYYGVVSLVTSALGAYLTSQITTIEKQFGLSSAQSGLLLSMNDIGFLIMVVFVSYFGRNAHIPKILSLCCFLYGISALVCTVPHLVTENSLAITGSAEAPQNINSPEEGQLCSAPNLSQNRDECESNQSSANSFVKIVAMTLISFGMLLQGVVKSPRSPLVQTYVDDNVSRTSSGLYISIILAMGIFGPALSFGIGGYISKIYVTLEETSLTPRDPRWVGAWWLGFLEFGILGVILAIPVFFFPKRLSNAPPKYQTISSPPEEKQKEGFIRRTLSSVTGLLSAIWRLLRRPVYVLVVFGSGLRVFTFAGIVAFQPKYLQVYYGLSIFKANVIVGFMSVGSAAVGIIIGGIIIHKLALEIRGMLKMVIITQAVSSLLFTAGIFLVCPQPEIHDFDLNGQWKFLPTFYADESASCAIGCQCDTAKFFPVCGSNGVSYFSPCHAGCQHKEGEDFLACTCVQEFNFTVGVVEPLYGGAKAGICPSECSLYIVFAILQLLSSFVTGIGGIPVAMLPIRTSDSRDKALAIGISSFVNSLLGWFLGPVIMGYVIDSSCRLWNTSCSRAGSCDLYDVTDYRFKYHGTDACVSFVYITCFVFAYVIYVTAGRDSSVVVNPKGQDVEMDDYSEMKPTMKILSTVL